MYSENYRQAIEIKNDVYKNNTAKYGGVIYKNIQGKIKFIQCNNIN